MRCNVLLIQLVVCKWDCGNGRFTTSVCGGNGYGVAPSWVSGVCSTDQEPDVFPSCLQNVPTPTYATYSNGAKEGWCTWGSPYLAACRYPCTHTDTSKNPGSFIQYNCGVGQNVDGQWAPNINFVSAAAGTSKECIPERNDAADHVPTCPATYHIPNSATGAIDCPASRAGAQCYRDCKVHDTTSIKLGYRGMSRCFTGDGSAPR